MQVIKVKENRKVVLRKLNTADFEKLFTYLDQLSANSKKRFGPHPFDKQSIEEFYKDSTHIGFVAEPIDSSEFVAYSIIKIGFLPNDNDRLQSYGYTLNNETDCTFAPSVADDWQSMGVGNAIFQFILSEIKLLDARRIILWGGVQADNDKAINYYKKNGFKKLGEFHHQGLNYDMILEEI